MAQFIGSKKISKTSIDGDDMVVFFKDESSFSIKKKLFDIIVTEKEGVGDVTDVVRHLFSVKFLRELSDYGLDSNACAHVANGVGTLAHNAREAAVCSKFGVDSPNQIKLEDIIDFV